MRGLSGTWWCCITAHNCIPALRVLRWADYDLDLVTIVPVQYVLESVLTALGTDSLYNPIVSQFLASSE